MHKQCLDQVRRSGFRLTPLRQALLTLLHAAETPLSAPEIERLLRQRKLAANKTTVYRSLELFGSVGLVAKTVINERTQYYELSERGHHHHFICTTCDTIRDIPLAEMSVLREAEQLGRKLGFTIMSHMLEFYGRCSACTRQNKIPQLTR